MRRSPSPARGLRRLKRAVLGAVLALLAAGGLLVHKADFIVLGAEAYIFGYPLVIMDVTRASALAGLGPENQLHRVRQFPDARFKDVVRPNVDTLYTTAFLDMDQGPWVFEIAASAPRFEVMPFMDGWTNVFAAPGTRTLGSAGGRFLIAGPRWAGAVPPGLVLLRAPTRLAWLIGRTQTDGAADYPTVHRLQDGIVLRSLQDWRADRHPAPPPWRAPSAKPAPPLQQMQAMHVTDFFTRLAALMVDNPAAAEDGPMLRKLAHIGIAPGQAPQWGLLDRAAVGLGRAIADWTVARELGKRPSVHGWITPPRELGNYGTFYNLRAVVAMVGLGANLPADAIYPSAAVDAQGRALHGDHRYRLHFPQGTLPPVRAFWSITAYGADDYFIDNPLHRYALGDRDPLVFNPDGALDLLVQAQAPNDPRLTGNWLPVKAGEPFLLNARLYWPLAHALDGRWSMPGIERLD